jgi:metallo-beta-lactamase family protein
VVTGSAYLVETGRARVLLDFGIFQGSPQDQRQNVVPRQLNAAKLDCVILTHGHLDHTGRLPLLERRGFAGAIYATPATIEMTSLILRDAAKVQAQDAERLNRRRQRAGQAPVPPLYGIDEVEAVLARPQPLAYYTPTEIAPGVTARVVEAGHMLGSVSIELCAEGRTAIFSGDLGPQGLPILRDAVPFARADVVFLESTYGDRDHKSPEATRAEALTAIRAAVARRGKILVPAFAVGRTQQILYELARAFAAGDLPRFDVFIDSPMAIHANQIYLHHHELLDEEARRLAADANFRQELGRFHTCESAEESKALNSRPGPLLVIAGSGMCHAGRILHHLRQNLWRPETLVMIVGYQGAGTLGRLLVDGKPYVSIFGERIRVAAQIATLGGYSAHAGQSDLLRWVAPVAAGRPQIILTHGEDRARQPLARLISERFGLQPVLPQLGDGVDV